jgi:hypothetical protein
MYTRKKEPRRYVKWMNLEENEEYEASYLLIIPTATQHPSLLDIRSQQVTKARPSFASLYRLCVHIPTNVQMMCATLHGTMSPCEDLRCHCVAHGTT